jgi:hypothetical protein
MPVMGVTAALVACLLWVMAASAQPTPSVTRVVIPAGAERVIIPLTVQNQAGAKDGGNRLRVTKPDGAPIPSTLASVTLVASPPGSSRWMGVPGSWRESDAADAPGTAGVLRVQRLAVIDRSGADPGGLIVFEGGQEVEVILGSAIRAGGRLDAAARRAVERLAPGEWSSELAEVLRPALSWPNYRARAGALLRAMDPTLDPDREPAGGAGVIRVVRAELPVLAALARQEQAALELGLSRVAEVDEPTADALADRLLALLLIDHAQAVPVWPSVVDEAALLAVLGDPRSSPEQARDAARSFLAAQPAAAGWVIDDSAGMTTAQPDQAHGDRTPQPGRVRASALVANLSAKPAVTWIGPANALNRAPADAPGEPEGDPLLIPAWSAISVEAEAPITEISAEQAAVGSARPLPASVIATVGSVRTTLAVRAARLPVVPPGATLGPLMQDWTMATFLAGVPSPPMGEPGAGDAPRPEQWVTAARLALQPVEEPERPGVWTLMVQSHFDPAVGDEGDSLEVWTGQRGRAAWAVRVGSNGQVEALAGPAGPATLLVRRTRRSDAVGVWWVSVPLPEEAIEPGGVLRLGIVRRDARGVRSAFPRAMMPGQVEPGRVMLGVAEWEMGGGAGR